MKALADNNLRIAEVSLFNGENRGPRSIPGRVAVLGGAPESGTN